MTITLMLQDVLSSKVDLTVIRVVSATLLNIKLFMRFLLYSNSLVTRGNS